MTDPKPKRVRNVNAALDATTCLGRVRAILADQEDRIADARSAIVEADAGKIFDLVKRVTDPKERDDLYTMATALKVFLPPKENDVEYDDQAADDKSASPNGPDSFGGTDDESHYAAQTKAEDLIPAGAREYRPGPAAISARRGR